MCSKLHSLKWNARDLLERHPFFAPYRAAPPPSAHAAATGGGSASGATAEGDAKASPSLGWRVERRYGYESREQLQSIIGARTSFGLDSCKAKAKAKAKVKTQKS